jgi:hypothetical protein
VQAQGGDQDAAPNEQTAEKTAEPGAPFDDDIPF